MPARDAIVIGSGPNGLAAAIVLAQAGRSVLVIEAEDSFGGGARSDTLTLPGFTHDRCSAVHPLAACSPFFRTLPLEAHGLTWIHPPAALAHPLDDGSAMIVDPSLTFEQLGLGTDTAAYRALIEPLLPYCDQVIDDFLGPLRLPRHPGTAARFAWKALWSAERIAKKSFRGERAKTLFAGLAAHSMLPLSYLGTGAFGLILALTAHTTGWPMPLGGAQSLTNALISYLRSLGGTLVKRTPVTSLRDLPPARAIMCDIAPRELGRIAGDRLPRRYRTKLERYRYGMAAFKIDWALEQPVPWRAAACRLAGTLHLGGNFNEIAVSEESAWKGHNSVRPFVLLSQPSLFDSSRTPDGKHTLWAYCHVANGSTADLSECIEAQIERFAPGFHRAILARSVHPPRDLQRGNRNLIGGSIDGGAADIRQLFLRPTWRTYATPVSGLYLCSASTPPGGGVHGMCGYYAAQRALNDCWR